MKSATSGTGPFENAVDVTHAPSSSNHATASGRCPPSVTADSCLQRERRDMGRRVELRAQFVGERGRAQSHRALTFGRDRLAVADRSGGLVVGAGDLFSCAPLPPAVENHAVNRRHRPGADAGMSSARHRVEIRVLRLAKPCAVGDQPPKPLRPLMLELVDVIAAHLVDHQQHEQLRGAGHRARTRNLSLRARDQRGDTE